MRGLLAVSDREHSVRKCAALNVQESFSLAAREKVVGGAEALGDALGGGEEVAGVGTCLCDRSLIPDGCRRGNRKHCEQRAIRA